MDAEPARAVETDIERVGGRPAEQLARLLDRADNGEQAARGLAEVHTALMHYCGLQSCRHAKGPNRPLDRRTFRHSFLLPDGGVRVLWELEHNTEPGGAVRRSVFTEREDVAVAEWEVDIAFGRPPAAAGPLPERPSPAPAAPGGPAPLEDRGGFDAFAPAAPERDGWHRAYTEGGSPEHARRLLRRASNDDVPGEEVHRRLRASIAHTIGIVTRRSALVAGRTVSWSLYEHAFLLLDGTELSLWEIDHTRTPTGNPVCEVYASRDAALDTAVRRIESA